MSAQLRPILSLAHTDSAGTDPVVLAAAREAAAARRNAAGAYTAFAAVRLRELFPTAVRALFAVTEDFDLLMAELAVVYGPDGVLWAGDAFTGVLSHSGAVAEMLMPKLSPDSQAVVQEAIGDALDCDPGFLTSVDLMLNGELYDGWVYEVDVAVALAPEEPPLVLVDDDQEVTCPHCGAQDWIVQVVVGRNSGNFTVEGGRIVAVTWYDAQLDTDRIECGACRHTVALDDDVEQEGR